MRAGTSIGSNLAEQEFAISDADYLNKTSIALKEAAESAYWLDLLHETEYISDNEFHSIHTDCNELISMLAASVKSIKAKLNR
ncbi:four helix bundle protein [Paludibacter sp.]|uniref:four helix bundle protein n=1 Tax=Paludibacter sp. TaxID=1898105 RepID=UPI0025F6DF75|nr:four helix bundle protein [Paludibacter sp.]